MLRIGLYNRALRIQKTRTKNSHLHENVKSGRTNHFFTSCIVPGKSRLLNISFVHLAAFINTHYLKRVNFIVLGCFEYFVMFNEETLLIDTQNSYS